MRSLGAPAVCIRPAEHLVGAFRVDRRRLGALLVPLRGRPHEAVGAGAGRSSRAPNSPSSPARSATPTPHAADDGTVFL